ncbi:aminotransferase class I/II-fold pyridoxal phosphate-dependent enzyme [Caedibacter taeniospiralis]|uniref:aminotransferase class I/II-fold pyridoxal phosphate-dependent enzyme n=1 Tax=Caedibacter taeniospiralis TaxID=28907 RepID=UPI000C26E058|nr:aminotransferase class I/II-fold pyridoxal phosphate-dependent enzyme [Caedibacter taeniospiralis]
MMLAVSNSHELDALKLRYQAFVNQGLSLDMTRGKPCAEQLDLSDALLHNLDHNEVVLPPDYRNYSPPELLTGLPELKKLFADVFAVEPQQIIIGGNSSLNLMYDIIIKALVHKLPGQTKSWSERGKIKFLCPTPGYDRHFAICESFGIEMINIPLTGHGPDMNQVEKLVAEDSSIKGMWCVPKYSNPTGECYSDETTRRLAQMPTAASDFRIFWDNAYALHHLDMNQQIDILNILTECEIAGTPDRAFVFASTSKITYAGAGVAVIAANKANHDWLIKHLKVQTIGYDKINQLHHLKLLPNKNTFMSHMAKHAAILKPKFNTVDAVLTAELGANGKFANWEKPKGGYFISFNSQPNLAKKIVKMAQDAGVKLTSAGATFPYGKDPYDCNIRIAPSLPGVSDLKKATEVLAVVTKIATLEQM